MYAIRSYYVLHKHQVASIEELIDLRDQLDARLQQFAVGDYELEERKKILLAHEEDVNRMARKLSEDRMACFAAFEGKIQES